MYAISGTIQIDTKMFNQNVIYQLYRNEVQWFDRIKKEPFLKMVWILIKTNLWDFYRILTVAGAISIAAHIIIRALIYSISPSCNLSDPMSDPACYLLIQILG